jgi:hypothetical protein
MNDRRLGHNVLAFIFRFGGVTVIKLTVNLRSEFICEYEGVAVFALYMNDKFAKMLTIDLEGEEDGK